MPPPTPDVQVTVAGAVVESSSTDSPTATASTPSSTPAPATDPVPEPIHLTLPPDADEDDELPPYAEVSNVYENEPEFMLEVQRLDDQSLFVGVSPVDSVLQLKQRIHSLQLDLSPESQHIQVADRVEPGQSSGSEERFLPNEMSIAQAGLGLLSVVRLCVRHESGSTYGPGPSNETVSYSAEDVELRTLPVPRSSLVLLRPSALQRPPAPTSPPELPAADVAGPAEPPAATAHDSDDTASEDEKESDTNSLPPSYSYLDRVESVIPPPNGGNNENISKIKLALGLIVLGFIYLILISLYFVLPMALLVVGIVHIHDCPVQDRIPVWMIIVAITIMTWGFLLRLATQYRNAIERELRMFGGAEVMERDRLNMEIERIFNLRHRHLNQFIGVIQGLNIILLIIGSVWIFSCKGPNGERGCHEGMYDLAFWFLITVYIVCALPFLIFAIWICIAVLLQQYQDRNAQA